MDCFVASILAMTAGYIHVGLTSFGRGDLIASGADTLHMIASLSLILLCQLTGEVAVRALGVPVPGPVVGLVLLLLLLLGRDCFPVLARGALGNDGVESASRALLANLSLLFVPAGVGVVQKLDLLAEHGIAILVTLAVSVVITLLATVATFVAASSLFSRGGNRP
jgi:holin-like protein